MREIGGYFELEKLISNEYYKNLIALNSGRTALIYLIKAKKISKVYIPYYICDSVYDMLKTYGYNYDFYKVKKDFTPDFKKQLRDSESVYIVNYYGQLSNNKIEELKGKYKNIIIDNTQAFFQEPVYGVDTIYSCRKWVGVSDGAYLSTGVVLNEDLGVDKSKDRFKYLLGRYEDDAASYYKYFKENDERIKKFTLKHMSKLTHNILGAIDYERIKLLRRENYAYLNSKLKKYNEINLIDPKVAYAYPLYLSNADKIREKLIENKIYIATLWPDVVEKMGVKSLEYKYAKNILPIPCDQRYSISDMEYMTKIIVEILGE
jgi:hypothetical protein